MQSLEVLRTRMKIDDTRLGTLAENLTDGVTKLPKLGFFERLSSFDKKPYVKQLSNLIKDFEIKLDAYLANRNAEAEQEQAKAKAEVPLEQPMVEEPEEAEQTSDAKQKQEASYADKRDVAPENFSLIKKPQLSRTIYIKGQVEARPQQLRPSESAYKALYDVLLRIKDAYTSFVNECISSQASITLNNVPQALRTAIETIKAHEALIQMQFVTDRQCAEVDAKHRKEAEVRETVPRSTYALLQQKLYEVTCEMESYKTKFKTLFRQAIRLQDNPALAEQVVALADKLHSERIEIPPMQEQDCSQPTMPEMKF